jgi:hypothetical protein
VASKKKKKQRSRQRQAAPAWSSGTAPAETEAGVISSPVPAARPATQGTPIPANRPTYASGITGPRRAVGGAAAATATIDIDARVPYFASDLRRVLITAAVMIVLIVAGSLLIK